MSGLVAWAGAYTALAIYLSGMDSVMKGEAFLIGLLGTAPDIGLGYWLTREVKG